MSEGMISFYEKSLGDSINIGKHQYIIVGIFSDYGHLWPRGEKEINENISPTNAIITKEQALTIYDDNERVLTQILIERYKWDFKFYRKCRRILSKYKCR